jgi:beta-glucosidase
MSMDGLCVPEHIEKLFTKLSLHEKVALVSGSDCWHTASVERLGIARLKFTDGPSGARGEGITDGVSNCFPAGINLGSTWDNSLVTEVGNAIAMDAKEKGAHVLLGPTINISRSPLAGRHFECFTEDPYLSGSLAVAYINGVQSQGLSACPKHFVCNDSEYDRHRVSVEVDERALHEVYLLPFEMAVREAAPLVVMSAYNQINGTYASSHSTLLREVLKKQWGFNGIVVSDWGAALETVNNAVGGLDLEMPGPAQVWGTHLISAIERGECDEAVLDDKVRRLLMLLDRAGLIEQHRVCSETSSLKVETKKVARKAATDSIILLKNDGFLPLSKQCKQTIAVIGPNAANGQIQGGGSAQVYPRYKSRPLSALLALRSDSEINIDYAEGCNNYKYVPAPDPKSIFQADGKPGLRASYFLGTDFSGDPIKVTSEQRHSIPYFGAFGGELGAQVEKRSFCVRLEGKYVASVSGQYCFGLASAGESRLLLNGELIVDNWSEQVPGDSFLSFGSTEKRVVIELEAEATYDLCIEFRKSYEFPPVSGVRYGILPLQEQDLIDSAVALAEKSDTVILVVGTDSDWESEGSDRKSIHLPGRQNELIQHVCDVNHNVIVVLNTGSPVAMPWWDKTRAIIQAGLPGQEFGNALVDILFGEVNPSAKTSVTYPRQLEDTAIYTCPGENHQLNYDEGVFVGYRWFDRKGITPLVPFGYGLSYTDFNYNNLNCTTSERPDARVQVDFTLTNSGVMDGAEVVQVYISHIDSPVVLPAKQLKAYTKVFLRAGEKKKVTLTLSENDFRYWNPNDVDGETGVGWEYAAGDYIISIGASSADIRLQQTLGLEF